MAVVSGTLTVAQFTVLLKLLRIVEAARSRGATIGEAQADSDEVAWTATEVTFSID